MSTLQQLRDELSHAWDHLAQGWHELRVRAGHALTRFKPTENRDGLETEEDRFLRNASRWGFLAAELSEDEQQIEVRLEVPGMEANDFNIHVVDNTLVVSGEKQIERKQTKGRYHVMECAYGRFERAIPLPVEVDDSKAKARYHQGVLQVAIPKSQQSRTKRIKISAA